MSETRLGRDVYVALAAIGWADGELNRDEADAILRTAAEEGLSLEEISAIEDATVKPVDIGVIDRSNLTKEDRLFVYAVAAWMSRLDGKASNQELSALAQLGDALKIPEGARQQADGIAQDVAFLPDGDRPDRFDLKEVRRVIGERLAHAEAIRTQQKG